jgi:type II secretory pathway pseudopilin PulG
MTRVRLTGRFARIAGRLRRDEGFTLIELLVTMSAAMVVMAALGTILTVTLRTTTETFTKMDATENARTALAHIEDELHSACIDSGVTPIEGGATGTLDSDANDLVFVSQFGTSASPTPVEHKITFNATNDSLTEYTYALATGADPSNWTFSSTPTLAAGKLLLNNVVPIYNSAKSQNIPIFQYFAYEPYTDVNGNSDMMLMDGSSSVPGTTSVPNPDPLTVPLSSSNAALTAEVMINFVAGATGAGGDLENTHLSDTGDPVTDSIVLRFTPPPNQAGSGTSVGPCE